LFLYYFFLIKRFFLFQKKNNKNLELLENFYFAKKKYHKQTFDLIFTNFLNDKNSVKNIMYNIEKRRKLSKFIYKKNIKFLI
tara:strand:- start:377 stop:622 length:246 start_codon:yes stop_codon:yes gene_type:complete